MILRCTYKESQPHARHGQKRNISPRTPSDVTGDATSTLNTILWQSTSGTIEDESYA